MHGHSVGGTNPALIEAMAASAFVIIHDNPFNKSVACNFNLSFANQSELSEIILDKSLLSKREEIVKENLKIINSNYRWDKIIDQYENYFLRILNKE